MPKDPSEVKRKRRVAVLGALAASERVDSSLTTE
jgi:hypothetical protein